MSTLVLRSVVNRALTSTEIDANFTALDTDKVETTAPVFSGTVILPSQSIALTDSNLPDVAPSLNLDFANSKQLDSRITFGRGSGGAYYDGKTTAKAEENLLSYSQDFGNTYWTKTNTSAYITSIVTAPDGTLTANKLVESTTASVTHFVTKSGFTPLQYTFSFYVKAAERSKILFGSGAGSTYWAYFDATTGEVSNVGTGVTGTCVPVNVGNGWWRLSITPNAAGGSNFPIALLNPATGIYEAYTGDGTSGIYLWGAQLEQRSSATAYTPTTTAPITNYIPVLLQAPLNTPRFDHDSRPTFNGTCTVSGSAVTLPTTFADGSSPSTINKFYTGSITISGTAYVITNYVGSTRVVTVTGTPTAGTFSLANKNYGQSLGLLIEESRENKLKYSSDFSNAIWALSAASIVNNTTISPDGTKNASLLIASTATGNHFAYNGTFPTASATSYTFSIYVKKAGYSTCLLNLYDQGGGASVGSAFFNVSTGVVLSSTAASASITPVGNDWYRCTITGSALSGALIPYIYLTNGTNYPSTGDGYSGIYIWGAQLEQGSFATSYIPTPSSSTVTRFADVAYMTGTNFSSWYNQSEGSFYLKLGSQLGWALNSSRLFNTSKDVYPYTGDTAVYLGSNTIRAAAFWSVEPTPISFVPSSDTGVGVSYTLSSINLTVNGVSTSATFPTKSSGNPTHFTIFGMGTVGGWATSGHLKKLTYYPKALSAPQLQGLTK